MTTTTDKKYLTCAETAVLVRKALKNAFPTQKFSVVSHTYSGGASIRVNWVEGPAEAKVRAITGSFTGADFDGSIDLKSYKSRWLLPDGSMVLAKAQGTVGSLGVIPAASHPKPHPDAQLVSPGADYIFTNRTTAAEHASHMAYEARYKAQRDARRARRLGH